MTAATVQVTDHAAGESLNAQVTEVLRWFHDDDGVEFGEVILRHPAFAEPYVVTLPAEQIRVELIGVPA